MQAAIAAFDGLPWIASHPWLYPLLEALHIVGIALLLGSLVLVDLRLWGRGAALPLEPFARFGLKLTLAGFALAAATGTTMFLSQPGELVHNRAFLLKLALLLAAGGTALGFHARGGLRKADATARALTLVSLGLWLAVIICGRWIAYV